ncbi:unnamed protein product [marine sediment metagenome]|uniref:Uncharacterized protein n=1 Tax=marine sediment metagenome TaxID=412755 RepID=X1CMK7_9ZZZZ
MLSPIGPTGGHIYRISDGKTPKTVGGKMAQLDRIYPTDDCGI